jgi:hypothetical protein
MGVAVESHTLLGRIERGESQPRADLILAVAELASARAAWLLTGEGSVDVDPAPETSQLALREIAAVIDRYRVTLPAEDAGPDDAGRLGTKGKRGQPKVLRPKDRTG